MRIPKTLLTGTGGALAILLAASFLAPKAVRAVTAALVQVVNTRSTPVPNQDVDQPARNPYHAFCNSNYDGFGNAQCNVNTPVPANMELVIQTVTVKGDGTPANQGASIGVLGGFGVFVPVIPQGAYWGNTLSATMYADPGTTPVCSSGGGQTNAFFDCAISGYLVSLP